MGAHQEAAEYILDELFEPKAAGEEHDSQQLFDLPDPYISSAMVYGSTAYGTSGIRSDLDILVFYEPSDHPSRTIGIIRDAITTASSRYDVSVEQNILPADAVDNDREHGMEPLFVQHLLEINDQFGDRWTRNNPTRGLQRIADRAEDSYTVNALAMTYVSGRRNYFAKALTESTDEINYNALQRAFELPSAIGRKVVAATMTPDDEPLDLSSRPSMNQRAREALIDATVWDDSSESTVKTHDILYNLDGQYSVQLGRALDGELSIEEYGAWLETRYLYALELAHDLANTWTALLRDRVASMRRAARSYSLVGAGAGAAAEPTYSRSWDTAHVDDPCSPEINDDFRPGSY